VGVGIDLEGKPRSSLWTPHTLGEGCCEPFFGSRYPDDDEMREICYMRKACVFYGLTAEWDAMWIHYFGHTAPEFVGEPNSPYNPFRPLPKGKTRELKINYFLHRISRTLRTNKRGNDILCK
jgi:hypothetical protein